MTKAPYLDKLRGAMAERRVSQREAAEQLGISQASLSSRLNGITPLRVDELILLASMLGVDASGLLKDAA
jgi:transcriptional regulator with XRE-family HTH domain